MFRFVLEVLGTNYFQLARVISFDDIKWTTLAFNLCRGEESFQSTPNEHEQKKKKVKKAI